MIRLSLSLLLLLVCGQGTAHHSTIGYYDRETFQEIEGVVSRVHWRNPHVKFSVDVEDVDGNIVEWDIELAALSIFRSRGLGEQFLHVGNQIKLQGNPAFNGSSEMGGTHILLPDGQEVVIALNGKPHFTDPNQAVNLVPEYVPEQVALAKEAAEGIYRVWSTVLNDPSFPMFKGGYPLADAATQAKAEWDPLAPERFECWEKGMPYLMVTPHPFEFVRDGADILMRFEEDDATRRIHMPGDGAQPPEELFHLGYSVGRWEGSTLVVETTNVSATKFDDAGTPLGQNARFVERFDLTKDEERLDYRLTVYDGETFTEPFDLTRFWAWVPGRLVGEWQCEI